MMIPYGKHYVDEEDVQAVADVLRHDWLTQGPKIAEFEEAIAQYVGAKYAVAVCNGTAALHLACLAAGLGKGDTVVTSSNTFVASANCARYVGAEPQFADIDETTLNMDPVRLAERCRELKQVKAIIPVHFAGMPCDMPSIRATAEACGAMVVEDAAHALGARYADGGMVGNCAFSDMTMFSFHPVKAITTGEGGLITTNDETLYRRLLRLRSHGINKGDDPYYHEEQAFTAGERNLWYYEMQELGFNYRITDIQCALGLSQLRKLPLFLERRRALALRYDRMFAEFPGIRPTQQAGRMTSGLHLYVVRIDFDGMGRSRHAYMQELRERSIVCQVHYVPVHMHPYYRRSGHEHDRFPVAEAYYRQALSLPLYYGLSDEEQDSVGHHLKDLLTCN